MWIIILGMYCAVPPHDLGLNSYVCIFHVESSTPSRIKGVVMCGFSGHGRVCEVVSFVSFTRVFTRE